MAATLGPSVCRPHCKANLPHVLLQLVALPLLSTLSIADAQSELSNAIHPAFMSDVKFGSEQRRNDWCSTARSVHEGKTSLRDALQGKNLSVVMRAFPFWVDVHDENLVDGGLHIELLDEIAQRAGFSWQTSFALVEGPDVDKNETWTQFMVWGISHYDLVVEWLVDNNARRQSQAAWAGHFLDTSAIIVTTATVEEPPFVLQLFSWTNPFHWTVWAVLVGTMFGAAFVYRQIECGYNDDDFPEESGLLGSIGHAFYLTFGGFTGAGGYAPRTKMGKFFTVAWTFAMLLITSAYTANLAQLIIVDKKDKLGVKSINDAQSSRRKLCVRKGTADESMMRINYPTIPLVTLDSVPELLESVRSKDCVGAVLSKMEWEIHQGRQESNEGCKIKYVDRPFKQSGAGWATMADSGLLCTNLARDVLKLHMMEMIEDGFVAEAYSRFLSREHDMACPTNVIENDDGKLTLQDMGGVFLQTGFICVIGLVSTIAYKGGAEIKRRTSQPEVRIDEAGDVHIETKPHNPPAKDKLVAGNNSPIGNLGQLLEKQQEQIETLTALLADHREETKRQDGEFRELLLAQDQTFKETMDKVLKKLEPSPSGARSWDPSLNKRFNLPDLMGLLSPRAKPDEPEQSFSKRATS